MYFSDQLPLPKWHQTPKRHQIVCYDVTKKITQPLMFKKTTQPLKSLQWGGVGGVAWSGVEWSESKFSDQLPQCADSGGVDKN